MKIHDSLFGGLLLLVGIAMWLASDNLPNPTMQPYGPGFFPKILAVLLVVTSAVLVVKSIGAAQPLFTLDQWARSPRSVLRVLLVPIGIILFVMFVGPVGFIPGSVALLFAMFVVDDVRPLPALGIAIAVVLIVHSIFYLGLSVQLPWGLLQPVRW